MSIEQIANHLNQTGKIILDTIIGALVIFLIIVLVTGDPNYFKQDKKTIKQIEQKIDTLKTNNDFITQRMFELEKNQIQFYDIINQNTELQRQNNQQLIKLQKLYNAKINSVNNYSIDDLDSFFRARYSQLYK
jgi:cell division protein FtsB